MIVFENFTIITTTRVSFSICIKNNRMNMFSSKTNKVVPTLSYQSGKGLESRLSQSGVYFALTLEVIKTNISILNMSSELLLHFM